MPEYGSMPHERESEARRETEKLDASPEVRWLRERYPVFAKVRFEENDDPSFEGGSFGLPKGEGDRPSVRIAAGGPERFARLKETRKEAIEAMAKELGIPFEKLDGEGISAFILFHEAGHAHDFLENYSEKQDASFEKSVADWRANSDAELQSLPLPDASPAELREEIAAAGGFDAWRKAAADDDAWCVAHGVTNERELLRIQEEAYRALDKERYADRFAAKMMAERRGGSGAIE